MKGNMWRFRLYVAGAGPRSLAAFDNLRAICAEYFHGRHEIEVVDLTHDASLGSAHGVTVVPTLVVSAPPLLRKIAGDLSNTESVLAALRFGVGSHAFSPHPVMRNGL